MSILFKLANYKKVQITEKINLCEISLKILWFNLVMSPLNNLNLIEYSQRGAPLLGALTRVMRPSLPRLVAKQRVCGAP